MIYVYILDYNIGKCDIISLENSENVEESLEELGYDPDNITYMVSDNLQLEINVWVNI